MNYLALLALLLTVDTYAGRFGQRRKTVGNQPAVEDQSYLPKPQLINSAKKVIVGSSKQELFNPQEVIRNVQTPFVAHALDMKNHPYRPKRFPLRK